MEEQQSVTDSELAQGELDDIKIYRDFIILEMPPVKSATSKLIYPKPDYGTLLKIVKSNPELEDSIYVEGHYALLNPDVLDNQILKIWLRGRQYAIVRYHEILIVTPTLLEKDQNGLQVMFDEARDPQSLYGR